MCSKKHVKTKSLGGKQKKRREQIDFESVFLGGSFIWIKNLTIKTSFFLLDLNSGVQLKKCHLWLLTHLPTEHHNNCFVVWWCLLKRNHVSMVILWKIKGPGTFYIRKLPHQNWVLRILKLAIKNVSQVSIRKHPKIYIQSVFIFRWTELTTWGTIHAATWEGLGKPPGGLPILTTTRWAKSTPIHFLITSP